MGSVNEPAFTDFFASSAGVCVYVTVGKRVIRVEFSARDTPGVARGVNSDEAATAIAAATVSLDRHRDQLQPLFARVEAELASRAGKKS